MQIIIKQTSAVKTLSLINSNSGIDYIDDFIGRTDAFYDGQFSWDEDRNAYVCDYETFCWWSDVVEDTQALNDRINSLIHQHGEEMVYDVIESVEYVDLEYHAAIVNKALDQAFGCAK